MVVEKIIFAESRPRRNGGSGADYTRPEIVGNVKGMKYWKEKTVITIKLANLKKNHLGAAAAVIFVRSLSWV